MITSPNAKEGLAARLNLITQYLACENSLPDPEFAAALRKLVRASVAYRDSSSQSISLLYDDQKPTTNSDSIMKDCLAASVLLKLPLPHIDLHLHYLNGNDDIAILDTPLVYAAQAGNIDLVKRLLQHKKTHSSSTGLAEWWNTGKRKQSNDTSRALIQASVQGHKDIVRLFLNEEYGFPNEGCVYEATVEAAVKGGHLPVLRILRHHGGACYGARIHSVILLAAAQWGHVNVVEMALQNGASLGKLPGAEENMPLTVAAAHGHIELVRLFLSYGVDLTERISYNNTVLKSALGAAAFGGHVEIVRLLISEAVQQKLCWNFEYTWWAAGLKGEHEVIRLLLEHGGTPGYSVQLTDSPLVAASTNGHIEVIELLLKSGIDIQGKHRESAKSALWTAAGRGYVSIVKLLAESGVDLNGTDDHNNPILWAAIANHKHVIATLEDLGAKPVDPLKTNFASAFRSGKYPCPSHAGIVQAI